MARITGFAVLVFLGTTVAAADQPPPTRQYIMIIITADPAKSGTGVGIEKLSFPSLASCAAAAKTMQADIRGGFVTARCLPTY